MFVDSNTAHYPQNSILHKANIYMAEKISQKAGGAAYVYYFKRQLQGDNSGAFHCAELWYVFGTLKYCWRPMLKKDQQLSDEMLSYWTNFMHTGNPNGENLSLWEKYSNERPFVKIFDI